MGNSGTQGDHGYRRGRHTPKLVPMEISRVRHVLSTATAIAFAFAAMLVLVLAWGPTASASPHRTTPGGVQSVLDAADVPGAAVTVVTSSSAGETVTTKGQPVTGPARVGSVSKGVAGAVADALVRDGKATLDETVGTYLPTLAKPYRDFTVTQLLTHTTGLPHDVTITDADRPDATAESLLGSLPADPALSTGYRYSSLNYILVQAVVEARSGMSYQDAVTHYLGADTLQANCATPVRQGRVPFFIGDVAAPEVCDGAGFGYGYLEGTQSQLAQWAQWNLSDPGREFHERSQQHSVEVREGQRYGFGWNYGTSRVGGVERATISHPGAVPGTYTRVTLVPDLDTAVVVSIPSYGELRAQETTDLADRAVAVALGDAPEPATQRTSTGGVIIGVVSALAFAALAGLALQTRRILRGRPRRAWRIAVAAVVAFLAWVGLVVGIPSATGVDVLTLATWAPDLGLLVVVLVACATVALVLSGLQRGRRTA